MKKELPPIFQNPDMDGTSFYWKSASETAILLFHGFTATTVEVRSLALMLKNDGYSVRGILLPGHGNSPKEMNQVTWKDWVNAAEEAYQNLKRDHVNVFIGGESMGGLLALMLAEQHTEISGVLAFAPAIKIPGLWQSLFIWPFINYVYKKNLDFSMPWQGFTVVPLHASRELWMLQKTVTRGLRKIQVPLVIFQGKLDQTIDPISSFIVLDQVSSTDKELIWLEESSHCILLDKQIDDVYQVVKKFITDHSTKSDNA